MRIELSHSGVLKTFALDTTHFSSPLVHFQRSLRVVPISSAAALTPSCQANDPIQFTCFRSIPATNVRRFHPWRSST